MTLILLLVQIFSCIENTIAKLKDMAKKNLIIVNEEVFMVKKLYRILNTLLKIYIHIKN